MNLLKAVLEELTNEEWLELEQEYIEEGAREKETAGEAKGDLHDTPKKSLSEGFSESFCRKFLKSLKTWTPTQKGFH